MHKPLHLTICLIALALVASGCGSTKKANTSTTAGTRAGTGAGENAQATTLAAGSNGARQTNSAQARKSAQAPKAPEAKSGRQANGSQSTTSAVKPITKPLKPTSPAAEGRPHPFREPSKGPYRFPLSAQSSFVAACTAAGGSKSSCECIIAKYETRTVEEGQALAELLGAELQLRNRGTLGPVGAFARRSKQYAKECRSALK